MVGSSTRRVRAREYRSTTTYTALCVLCSMQGCGCPHIFSPCPLSFHSSTDGCMHGCLSPAPPFMRPRATVTSPLQTPSTLLLLHKPSPSSWIVGSVVSAASFSSETSSLFRLRRRVGLKKSGFVRDDQRRRRAGGNKPSISSQVSETETARCWSCLSYWKTCSLSL